MRSSLKAHNLFIFRRIDLYAHAGMLVPHFGISDQFCQSYTCTKPPSILGKSTANRYSPMYSSHDSTGKKCEKLIKTINCTTKLDEK